MFSISSDFSIKTYFQEIYLSLTFSCSREVLQVSVSAKILSCYYFRIDWKIYPTMSFLTLPFMIIICLVSLTTSANSSSSDREFSDFFMAIFLIWKNFIYEYYYIKKSIRFNCNKPFVEIKYVYLLNSQNFIVKKDQINVFIFGNFKFQP